MARGFSATPDSTAMTVLQAMNCASTSESAHMPRIFMNSLNMRGICALSLVLAQFIACSTVIAVESGVAEKPLAIDTAEQFAQKTRQIQLELQPSGRYEFLGADERHHVEDDLARMAKMIKSTGSISAMQPEQKVELFNAQERVNAILTKNDGNRLVCEHHRTTGSMMLLT